MGRTVTAPPITQPGPAIPPPIEATAERAVVAAAVAAAAVAARAAAAAAAVVSMVPDLLLTAATSLRPVTVATGGGNMPAPVKGVMKPWRCTTGAGTGVGVGAGCVVEPWPSKVALATTAASTRNVSPTCVAQNEHSLGPRRGGWRGEGGGGGGAALHASPQSSPGLALGPPQQGVGWSVRLRCQAGVAWRRVAWGGAWEGEVGYPTNPVSGTVC